jgi:tRNA A-37 threonylcarbamoyl transferase component Bud32
LSEVPLDEYERLVDGSAEMLLRSARRRMLHEAGFVRFADYVHADRGEEINAHGRRRVRRLTLGKTDDAGTFYLKTFGPGKCTRALRRLWHRRRVETLARREFKMVEAFREAGLGVPEAVAMGERRLLGFDRAAFLLTAELPGARALDDVLHEGVATVQRRALFSAVAAYVRRMHAAGLVHRDLFAKHVLVTPMRDARWDVATIDLQRASKHDAPSPRARGRDLAALLVSLPPGVTTPRERLRFWHDYTGARSTDAPGRRFLAKHVLPQAAKLSRRRVYAAWRPVLGVS